jgi:hypothetical protein
MLKAVLRMLACAKLRTHFSETLLPDAQPPERITDRTRPRPSVAGLHNRAASRGIAQRLHQRIVEALHHRRGERSRQHPQPRSCRYAQPAPGHAHLLAEIRQRSTLDAASPFCSRVSADRSLWSPATAANAILPVYRSRSRSRRFQLFNTVGRCTVLQQNR